MQDVLQHEMIEIVFMGRQEDDGISLFEGCDAITTVPCGEGNEIALLVLPLAWVVRRARSKPG